MGERDEGNGVREKVTKVVMVIGVVVIIIALTVIMLKPKSVEYAPSDYENTEGEDIA